MLHEISSSISRDLRESMLRSIRTKVTLLVVLSKGMGLYGGLHVDLPGAPKRRVAVNFRGDPSSYPPLSNSTTNFPGEKLCKDCFEKGSKKIFTC